MKRKIVFALVLVFFVSAGFCQNWISLFRGLNKAAAAPSETALKTVEKAIAAAEGAGVPAAKVFTKEASAAFPGLKEYKRMDALGIDRSSAGFLNKGALAKEQIAQFKNAVQAGSFKITKQIRGFNGIAAAAKNIRKVILFDAQSGAYKDGFLIMLPEESLFLSEDGETLTHYIVDRKTKKVIITNKISLTHISDTHGGLRRSIAGLDRTLPSLTSPYAGAFHSGDLAGTMRPDQDFFEQTNSAGVEYLVLGNNDYWNLLDEYSENLSGTMFAFNVTDRATGQMPKGMRAFKRINVNGVNFVITGASYTDSTKSDVRENDLAESFNSNVRPYIQDGDFLIIIAHASDVPRTSIERFPLKKLSGLYDDTRTIILAGHGHNVVTEHKIGSITYSESGAFNDGFNLITINADPFKYSPVNIRVDRFENPDWGEF